MGDKSFHRVQTEEHKLRGAEYCTSFGERLEYIREEYGLTKSAMAKAVGVSSSTWGTYEYDSSFPAMNTISKFCELFNVDMEWLFSGEGDVYTDEDNEDEES